MRIECNALSLLAVVLLSSPLVGGAPSSRGKRITQEIYGVKRNVLFSSRHLAGECVQTCVPSDTLPPFQAPTDLPTATPTRAPTTSPTDSPTGTPTGTPTQAPTVFTCPDFHLDFSDATAGTFIHDEWYFTHGVKITAKKKDGVPAFTPRPNQNLVHYGPGAAAMIFDTNNPVGSSALGCSSGQGNSDLGYANEGNALVIQKTDTSCPISADGGYVYFNFRSPTDVKHMKFLDVDSTSSRPKVTVKYGGGTVTLYPAATGNNGVSTLNINRHAVTEIKVEFFASGAISDLVYPFCPPAPCPTNANGSPLHTWDFNDLEPATWVHNQFAQHGVKVRSIPMGDKGYEGPDSAAYVLDTLRPKGYSGYGCPNNDGDEDLGSPNEHCPVANKYGTKPGEADSGKISASAPGGSPYGLDGVTKNPYANCEPLGNVLIIQESNKRCPDDSGSGGRIVFTFETPSYVQLGKLLDIDEGRTPDIRLTDENDVLTTITTTPTGDNGLWSQPILLDKIKKIDIRYYGSGSISELQYEFCPP